MYDLSVLRASEIDIVRRPTGGRAILHHREVTYSVTAPIDDSLPLRETYTRINRILQSGLSRLGVFVETAARSDRAAAPSVRPCFEIPGEGELVAEGAKLVGSAQWRDGGALLQHGSILVDDDQSSLPLFATDSGSFDLTIPAPATLHSILGRSPDVREVATAMFDAVRALEDEDASQLAEQEIRDETLEHVAHFLDEDWTWRR
jgi:lipoate-protein ligase A